MICWLANSDVPFPPLNQAYKVPNGLLAASEDLTIERIVEAYQHGIFPWYAEGEPVLWWSPNPRSVIFPADIHVSRSMRKRLKKKDYLLVFDKNFSGVIGRCASRGNADGTWIGADMKQAYIQLYNMGIAHSVELYIDNELVGGLYGLAMGKLFFGESMFSHCPNASKIVLIALARQLQQWGYALIDCQVENPHLDSMGACDISRDLFKQYLERYLDSPVEHEWQFDTDLNIIG